MDQLPSRIGPYLVRRLIGAGAMGLVYLGHDPAINRPVAIKTIRKHLLDQEGGHDSANRFRVEAQAAGRLHHPGIVSIYQFGEDHDCDYIAMEYVEGHTLSDYLARPTRFSREDVLCLMFQLLEALDYAHGNGVVHRDIKPANLMISRAGQLKITDFGIARLEATQLTQANMMVGSPGFMAPEQYTDSALDRRVDVFAAGVLLYYLLTGRLPFSGSNETVMYKVLYELPEPLPPDENGRDFADFWPVVLTALAKQPQQRYPSAHAMHQALAGLVREQPVERLLAITCVMPGRAPSVGTGRPPSLVARAPVSSPASVIQRPATEAMPWPTGWNEATLAGLEHDLARHVGPIAKVLVRKAARQYTTLEGVRQGVAEAITNPTERQHFLQTTRSQLAPGHSGAGGGTGARQPEHGSAPAQPRTGLLRRLLPGSPKPADAPPSQYQPSQFQPSAFQPSQFRPSQFAPSQYATGHFRRSQMPNQFPDDWPPSRPSGPREESSAVPPAASMAPTRTATGMGPRPAMLDTEALERIGTVLTRTIGPIAKVLVRRCAAQSLQPEQFIELLLGQIDPRLDREGLRTQLLAALR